MRRFFSKLTDAPGLVEGKVGLLPLSEFTDEFLQIFRITAPQLEAVKAGDSELRFKDSTGKETRAFLNNAYSNYKLDPASKDEVIRRYVDALIEESKGSETDDPARIIPIIKDRRWLAETKHVLGFEAAENVFDDYNDELVVVYAEDMPRNIRYLTPKRLEEMRLQRNQLRPLSIKNLRAILPKIEEHRGPEISMITAGGDYVASLLLFDDLWSGERFSVDGVPVVAIPSRDVLLLTGSNNAPGIERLRQAAQKAVKQSSYALVDTLFIYRQSRFEALDADGTDGNNRLH